MGASEGDNSQNKSVKLGDFLLRGASVTVVGKLGAAVVGYLMTSLVTRVLSLEDAGAYFLAFNLATFLGIIGQAGVSIACLRLVSQACGSGDGARARAVFASGFRVILVISGCVAAVMTVAGSAITTAIFGSASLAAVSQWIALWGMCFALERLVGETFRGVLRLGMTTLFGGLFARVVTLMLVGILWLSAGDATLPQFLGLVVGGFALNSIVGVSTLRRSLSRLPGADSTETERQAVVTNRRLLTDAWPMFVNQLLLFGLLRMDTLVAGYHLPDSEVALYGVSARTVQLVGLITTVAVLVAQPLIARLHKRVPDFELERVVRVIGTLTAIPAFSVIGVLIAKGPALLQLFFGEAYLIESTLLTLMLVRFMTWPFFGVGGSALNMTGHAKLLMVITCVSFVISFVSSMSLAPIYGAEGVAAGFAMGSVCRQLCAFIAVRVKVGIWTHMKLRGITEDIKWLRTRL